MAEGVAAVTGRSNNNNNNERGQTRIPGGEEHAQTEVSSSLSAPSLPSSEAAIPTPAANNAVLEVLATEAAAAAAAVLVEQEEEDDDNHDDAPRPPPLTTPYEIAVARASEIQSKLTALLSQKSRLETSTWKEWSAKIANYEAQSLREMNDELRQLQNAQDTERKALEEQLRMENEMEEKKLQKRIDELKEKTDARRNESKKRSRRDGVAMDNSNNGKKKNNGGVEEEVDQATNNNSSNKNNNNKNNNTDDKEENYDGEEKVKMISRSAEKEKELENIENEVMHLNKTKSQMIWLLKQVITVETTMKLKHQQEQQQQQQKQQQQQHSNNINNNNNK